MEQRPTKVNKSIVWSRKLHCRLNVDTRTLIREDPKNAQEEEQTSSSIDVTTDASELQSTSNNLSSSELQHLMEKFLTKTQNQIQLALTEYGNMNDAVLALTTSVPEENDIIATTNLELKKLMTLSEWLNYL